MSIKIAVAVIHGIGMQQDDFDDGVKKEIIERFVDEADGATEADIVVEPIFWADVTQDMEDELWNRVNIGGPLDWKDMRGFTVNFLGDAIAYQQSPEDRAVYDQIHGVYADTLKTLAAKAGGDAPLCVIAHSLGSIITGNYFYDLHKHLYDNPTGKRYLSDKIKDMVDAPNATPLERGDSFAHFFTLGSPVALWALRHTDFGKPVTVPSEKFRADNPGIEAGWYNYYDEDDILAYPIKPLNNAYSNMVKADVEVNVGSVFVSWNPLCHLRYWTDNDVTRPIAAHLAKLWKDVNP